MISSLLEVALEVRRGAKVSKISKPSQAQPGTMPTVTTEQAGRVEEVHTRLVVGADGLTSGVHKWAGFHVQQDPDRRMLTGMLFEDMPGPLDDTNYLIINPDLGQIVAVFPQGEGRVRTYLGYEQEKHTRFQGPQDLSRFTEQSVKTGASPEWFTVVKSNGPLATFHGADTWVAHPYQAGVVLIGDAAASNDPSYGQGLSLAVRDVRVLRDQLLQHDNWETAGHEYAAQHNTYYSTLHTVTRWFGQLLYASGSEADARRAYAFPFLVQDKMRIPDVIISGPEAGATEERNRAKRFIRSGMHTRVSKSLTARRCTHKDDAPLCVEPRWKKGV